MDNGAKAVPSFEQVAVIPGTLWCKRHTPFACPAACHPGLKTAVGDAGAPWARELEREPVFKSGLQVMHRNMWCALLEAVSLLHPVVWRIRGDHIADISSHSSTVCNVELSN